MARDEGIIWFAEALLLVMMHKMKPSLTFKFQIDSEVSKCIFLLMSHNFHSKHADSTTWNPMMPYFQSSTTL